MRKLQAQLVELEQRGLELEALSSRLMQIQKDERSLLAAELHDDPLQRAVLLACDLRENASGQAVAIRWQSELDEIIISLRSIAAGLRPIVLDDLGLAESLERVLNEARARSEVGARYERITSDGRLPPNLETTLYRVAQEGLANCLKHAHPTEICVLLHRDESSIGLQIVDNGRGPAQTSDQFGPGHFGLLGLREPLRSWHGSLKVGPGPRGGTVLSVEIPRPGIEH